MQFYEESCDGKATALMQEFMRLSERERDLMVEAEKA